MWFDSWSDIGRIVLVGAAAYAGLVVMLRITGKRTLSKMNAFDLVVTVALGSTLATAILSSQTSLADGLTAFALLCFLQYAATYASVRSKRVQGLIKGEPALVFHGGAFLNDAMKRERVTREEVEAAARSSGCAGLDQVHSVVLETDGSFSVITGEAAREDLLTQARG
ncbi:MAG: DUF421 domain-containing protein [Oceanicaulis sp.]